MADIFSTGGTGNQLDSLIETYRSTFDDQKNRLLSEKSNLERSSSYFNALNGRLNGIISQLDGFERSDAADNFTVKKVTSSNSDYVTATAKGNAIDGLSTIKVKQLARNDRLLSGQIKPDEEFGLSGEQTISFTVDGEQKSVTLELDGTETKKEALTKVVEAINDAEINISAGLLNQSSDALRFSLRADDTGEKNKVDFADNAIFTALGLTRDALNMDNPDGERLQQTGNEAGFQSGNLTDLNALAEINGVDISRSSNTFDDVLTDVSFNLLKVQEEDESEITLNIEVNPDSVKSYLQPFVDSYNNLIGFLNSDRTMLRSDAAISSLRFQLRDTLTQNVKGLSEDDPEYISNFGFGIASNGTLSINDTEALENILESDPDVLSNFFLGEGGFVSKIKNVVNRVKSEDNDLIKDRTLDFSQRIARQDDRIETLESRIDRQAAAQREQYTSLLSTYYDAQQQYSSFNSINNF
ncbi:flagellar filament capping protein FliD [Candidatus Kapabacteria bacterium]|nr:flagellar filament capping protein FliD [Candidatus Kapabacteria bacterium]